MNFNTEKPKNKLSEQKQAQADREEMRVICSGILRKDGKKIIYVRFERGKDFAEGSIPVAKITSQSGFLPDEIAQFEQYMEENKFEIIEQAKSVNVMKNFMK